MKPEMLEEVAAYPVLKDAMAAAIDSIINAQLFAGYHIQKAKRKLLKETNERHGLDQVMPLKTLIGCLKYFSFLESRQSHDDDRGREDGRGSHKLQQFPQEDKQEVQKNIFLNNYFNEDPDGILMTDMEKDLMIQILEEGVSLWQDRVQKVIATSNIHEHTDTCKKGDAGKTSCRVNFPRELTETTGPHEIESLLEQQARFGALDSLSGKNNNTTTSYHDEEELETLNIIAKLKRKSTERVDQLNNILPIRELPTQTNRHWYINPYIDRTSTWTTRRPNLDEVEVRKAIWDTFKLDDLFEKLGSEQVGGNNAEIVMKGDDRRIVEEKSNSTEMDNDGSNSNENIPMLKAKATTWLESKNDERDSKTTQYEVPRTNYEQNVNTLGGVSNNIWNSVEVKTDIQRRVHQHLNDLVSLMTPANDCVVEYNEVIALLCGCNQSLNPLGNTQSAITAAHYISKYIATTSCELSTTLSLLQMIKTALEDIQKHPSIAADAETSSRKVKHLMARLINNYSGSIEIPETLACRFLMGEESYVSTHNGVFVFNGNAIIDIRNDRKKRLLEATTSSQMLGIGKMMNIVEEGSSGKEENNNNDQNDDKKVDDNNEVCLLGIHPSVYERQSLLHEHAKHNLLVVDDENYYDGFADNKEKTHQSSGTSSSDDVIDDLPVHEEKECCWKDSMLGGNNWFDNIMMIGDEKKDIFQKEGEEQLSDIPSACKEELNEHTMKATTDFIDNNCMMEYVADNIEGKTSIYKYQCIFYK